MKRVITIILTLLAAANLQAQDILTRFETERITCKYSYGVTTPMVINYSGDAVVQGNCYYLNGNGLEVFCDGVTRWTKDADAQEVYIENAEDVNNMLQTFLLNAKNLKYSATEVSGTYTDNAQNADINFKLTSLVYEKATEDLSTFVLDVKKLDAAYIITDLR